MTTDAKPQKVTHPDRMHRQEDGHNKNPFGPLLERLLANSGCYSVTEIGQLKWALDGFYGALPQSAHVDQQFGGCPDCGSRNCVARECTRTVSHKAQTIPGVQWQCGHQASGFTALAADSVTTPAGSHAMEITDYQVLIITTAYEQGVGKGRQAFAAGREISNPYSTGYRCDLAWSYGYEEGKEQAARMSADAPTPPTQTEDSVLEDDARWRDWSQAFAEASAAAGEPYGYVYTVQVAPIVGDERKVERTVFTRNKPPCYALALYTTPQPTQPPIKAEVRKQDDALILQLVEALENYPSGRSQACIAGRARLEDNQ